MAGEINIQNSKGTGQYLLLKFFSKYEYLEDFINGKLFFNSIDYFANSDTKGQGDPNEGNNFIIDNDSTTYISAQIINNGTMIKINDYSNDKENYVPNTIFSYSSAINRRRKLISFYTMFYDSEKEIFSNFDNNMISEFGEYAVLIINPNELIERIKKVAKQNEYTDFKSSFIEYKSLRKNKGFIEWNCFCKDDIYSYQNEYRISFVSNSEQRIVLDLKSSLRDIVKIIDPKDLDCIHFSNGLINYPVYKVVNDNE